MALTVNAKENEHNVVSSKTLVIVFPQSALSVTLEVLLIVLHVGFYCPKDRCNNNKNQLV